MRTFYKMTKAISLMVVAMAMGLQTNATTFTALLSGNFSSTTTWQGGIVPSKMQNGDEIVVLTGVTLNLDQNLKLESGNTLNVIGNITSTGGYYLSLESGATLKGTGNINVDSCATNLMSGFDFTGKLTAETFTSANAMVSGNADIVVNNTLHLVGGTMTMASGKLTLSQNATIVVDGGMMTVTGGTADLTNSYNVRYQGSAGATAGIELTGSGLKDITIATSGNGDVKLSADLTTNSTLMLSSGSLDLNGNNLTIGTSGDISASGSGTIKSSSNSDINIFTSGSLSGGLRFAAGGNTVDDFTINLGSNSASVMIDGDMMISGQLDLQSGRINANGNKITIMTNATVTGGSGNSFVICENGGRLVIDVAANSSQNFHVGTSGGYMPAVITATSGSASSTFSIGVDGMVMQDGNSGAAISATQPMVNATWFVESSASANVEVDMELMWDASAEVNSFDRTKAYIAHYTNAAWEADASASATMQTSGMYSIKRTGIKSFSPFAVFDENTAASVNDVLFASNVSVYPNPASSVLNIAISGNTAAQAKIYSVSGQLMQSTVVDGNAAINISNLPDGMYYVRLQADNATTTQKFIKQ